MGIPTFFPSLLCHVQFSRCGSYHTHILGACFSPFLLGLVPLSGTFDSTGALVSYTEREGGMLAYVWCIREEGEDEEDEEEEEVSVHLRVYGNT